MTRVIAATITGLVFGGVSMIAEQKDAPKKPKEAKHAVVQRGNADVTQTAERVSWTTHDVEIIRRHYVSKHRELPPGLRKKYQRTGQLPPGWQKKMEPLPATLQRDLTPLPTGYLRGVFDAHAVIYNSQGTIVDVTVLF